jgi:hypothetical protein
MNKIQLNAAIADHVEVLRQYATNTNTDKPTLAAMCEVLLCKFHRKDYFNLAMKFLFPELAEPQKEWALLLHDYLCSNTFAGQNELVVELIANVKKFYKIK